MTILDQLASSRGQMTQDANVAVAAACLAKPGLLAEIVAGLRSRDDRVAGDCAEVMTKVAEARPELAAPHSETLWESVGHKNGRVRWESAHALGLVARTIPVFVATHFAILVEVLRRDPGVIVRDYIVDTLTGYASTSPAAAGQAFPVLVEAAGGWEGKHAARVLTAMKGLLPSLPERAAEIRGLAERLADHERSGVRKASAALLKAAAGSAPQKKAKK